MIPIVSLLFRRLSLSRKRNVPCVESQKDTNICGTREKTPPASRKKSRGTECGGKHQWTARDRTVITKMKHSLDRCESLEVSPQFDKKPLVSEEPDACGGPERSFDMQVDRSATKVDRKNL